MDLGKRAQALLLQLQVMGYAAACRTTTKDYGKRESTACSVQKSGDQVFSWMSEGQNGDASILHQQRLVNV